MFALKCFIGWHRLSLYLAVMISLTALMLFVLVEKMHYLYGSFFSTLGSYSGNHPPSVGQAIHLTQDINTKN